ncbi:MAG: hydrolase [Bacteroidetes bacterium]|nr:hydrolase [Bacteroidota bacterium]
MKIAVDFDGTIVEHKYPAIGEIKPFAFETLRELQKKGHQLIMWTYRWGKELDEAVEFCRKNGLEFYAVNKSYPEEVFSEEESSRKLDVDLFIDDRNLGGFVEWSDVWRILHGEKPLFEEENNPYSVQHKQTSFIEKLFGKK